MLRLSALAQLPPHGLDRVALTCGVFDGVHRGHQAILTRLHQRAAAHQANPVILTFWPHPMSVLAPGFGPPLIISQEHKLQILERAGLAAAVIMPFTDHLSRLGPHEFLARHLRVPGLTIASVCVGRLWRFGHQAAGNVPLLAQWGQPRGMEVIGVSETMNGPTRVSSTRVRKAIAAGDLGLCERLLGRPFSVLGPVIRGKGIATGSLHYPTANIAADNEIFPPDGIYAANAVLRTSPTAPPRRLPGILYLGHAPTFGGQSAGKPTVEMHIFDFAEDLYGQELEVELLSQIRPDRRFDSVAELRQQITRDIAVARRCHERRQHR